MWRIFNGLSRGFRARTPAPPSQTSPWSEENDSGGSHCSLNITEIKENNETNDQPCYAEHEIPIVIYKPKNRSHNATEITQRILGSPSEADVLLQEYFGSSWKQKTTEEDHRCKDIPEHIWNGFGLGTVWMTAIVLGRAAFSNWRNHSRRRQISCDNVSSWYEFEQRYINEMRKRSSQPVILERPRCWDILFHILPKTISRSTVLAAGIGSDIADSKTIVKETSSDKIFSIKITGSFPKNNIVNNTTSIKQQKSVSFDKNCYENGVDSADSYDAESESSNTFSEEAIEQFTEDARSCSGATFNILGLQSVKSGKKKEAFHRFQLGSREGYSKAQFNLALCYEKGCGTNRDKSKAIEMYEKAAYKGHTKAQYNLALILLEKDGIANRLHAIRLLEKAAMNGFVQAQSYLGAYLTKSGEFQDMKKAVKMFKMAAEQGDVKSKYHLGICYQQGLGGLKQDLTEAFDLYSSAATADHLDAHYNMAVMIQKGFGDTEKNHELAQELLKKAAKQGHLPSSRRLKEIKISKNTTATWETETKSPQPYKVYYSKGRTTSSRPAVTSNQPCQSNAATEIKRLQQIAPSTKFDQARSILMPSMLSQHISNLSLFDGLQILPLDQPQRGSVQQGFEMATGLVNDPITDAVQDLLSLRRVSTTPANLCYHSPIIREPLNTFSLEV